MNSAQVNILGNLTTSLVIKYIVQFFFLCKIVSWFLKISQDFPGFVQHDYQIVFVLIFISVQNNFMIIKNKDWEKRGKNHESTNNAMSNNGSSIEIIDPYHGD